MRRIYVGRRSLLCKTCTRCGELRPGSDYYLGKKGYASDCRACHARERGGYRGYRKLSKEAERKKAAKFRARKGKICGVEPSHHRQPYTGVDWEILLREDLTITQKAIALGRTYSAVTLVLFKYRNGDATPRRLTEPHPLRGAT